MKYDFQSVPDRRGTGANKWDQAPGASPECVPLTTADMEFPMAPEIVESLQEYAKKAIFGYTGPTERYYEAVCNWMKEKHQFEVKPEWILPTPGVVYALGILIHAMSEPGDSVIILSPVYYPFDQSVMASGRKIVYSPLKTDGTRYVIDYEDLEKKAAQKECRLLLFCNPHNPVGRVWDREELEKVVDICYRNQVFIIDDEIHHDLIMPGYHHTVMATLSEKARQICAVCTAPSKTFNLAGLQCSNIIIPDQTVYAKTKIAHTMNLQASLNSFAYEACIAAYTKCDKWLEELLSVIRENAEYVTEFMAEHFPEVTVYPLEGTYLLWLDMRGLGMTHKELEQLMKEDAKLYLDEGYMFGTSGRGFERINLACSKVTLEHSMERFLQAMETRRKLWEKNGRPYHCTLAPEKKLERFVYDTAYESGIVLAERIDRPTILIFSRYYSCVLCQGLLSQLKASWEQIGQMGVDVKVVLQSTAERMRGANVKEIFPFEIICDPNAVLYDQYNVFEADSELAMLNGEDGLMEKMGGIRNILLSMGGGETEGRSRQLPAVFLIRPDMTVGYAYYGNSLNDYPELDELMRLL